jgi:hypothetical protein
MRCVFTRVDAETIVSTCCGVTRKFKGDVAKVWRECHQPSAPRPPLVPCTSCNEHGGNVRIKVHRHMPVEALARLLAEQGSAGFPAGWELWPVADCAFDLLAKSQAIIRPAPFVPPFGDDGPAWSGRAEVIAAHAHALRRKALEREPYPGFAGRGIVIVGGGTYFPGAYVAACMARHVGWEGPIQIWHRGADEPADAAILGPLDVELVDSDTHPARSSRRLLGGWEHKTFAIRHSPFQEVLYLDADAYLVADPSPVFAANRYGAVFWPDLEQTDHNVKWALHGELDDPHGQGIQGGHVLLDKARAWDALCLADWINDHSDFYYQHQYGDQDSWRLAWRVRREPFCLAHPRPNWVESAFVQYGLPPRPRPLFVHRCGSKMFLPEALENRGKLYCEKLPLEAVAWGFLERFAKETSASFRAE